MPRVFRLSLLLVIVGAAACGQKGPLILPDAKKATPVPAQPAATAPDDKKDKSRPR